TNGGQIEREGFESSTAVQQSSQRVPSRPFQQSLTFGLARTDGSMKLIEGRLKRRAGSSGQLTPEGRIVEVTRGEGNRLGLHRPKCGSHLVEGARGQGQLLRTRFVECRYVEFSLLNRSGGRHHVVQRASNLSAQDQHGTQPHCDEQS